MHGRGGEEKKRVLHMWTAPTPTISAIAADVSLLSSPVPNSFYKDGRRICIGDCALFKLAEESLPFIGIIRCVTPSEGDKLTLGVNWFYRPAEITLGKGILLEAAPNEVFYSFHQDETSAASLLHPCKVSFLPKGVELPSGVSSFVCRRVYDIRNNCLWWLTDQHYIDEHQEEVNHLLSKTHIEMHGTVQSGGHSPKPMNGPTATSQSKPGLDSVQNSGSSFPSQFKGKKRERVERGDPGLEPIKRKRSVKLEDGDSANSRIEGIWKSEVAKLKDKGGLADFDAVEKLVQLMLYDRNEKKIDLVGRSIMAGVVASTDKFDCLDRFVQLRGLPVFDEWIHEVHKGRSGDGNGFKDSDKSAEEFLSVILRALDKLPVDLHALQTCNIGKSVNHLRTHRNLEIQKKAKGLVDTWKRRVEAEMDAKSGSNQGVSWAARSRFPDASHVGTRHTGIATDVTLKSSTNQICALKPAPVNLIPGETIPKSASGSPGPNKSMPVPVPSDTAIKEGQSRYGAGASMSIASPTMVRDEKSSSSSQSHSNNQAVSGDQNKTLGVSGKEDARSSGSATPNRAACGSSRHRKLNNTYLGQGGSVVQRETGSSRNSPSQRNPGAEKFSQISSCEKVADFPTANSQKFVVKIHNRGCSPVQSVCEGSVEDPSTVHNRSCSPLHSEKQDQLGRSLKDNNVVNPANVISDVKTESWQSNDFKDVLNGSDEGDGSPVTGLDDEHSRASEDTKKLADVSKSTSLPSSNENKFAKLPDASFSSINALIESCAKYSDTNASTSTTDDVGMNLLATVAAEEISKPDLIPPASSPKQSTLVRKQCNAHIDSRVLSLPGDNLAHERGQSVDNIAGEPDNSGGHVDMLDVEADKSSQDKVNLEHGHDPSSCVVAAQKSREPGKEKEDKTDGILSGSFVGLPAVHGAENKSGDVGNYPWKVKASSKLTLDGIPDAKEKPVTFSIDNKVNVGGVEVGAGGIQTLSSHSASNVEAENKKASNEYINPVILPDEKPPAAMHSNNGKKTATQMLITSGAGQEILSNCHQEAENEKVDETPGRNPPPENPKTDRLSNTCSTETGQKDEHEERIESTGANEQKTVSHDESHMQLDQRIRCRGSQVKGGEADEMEESCSVTRDASVAATGSQVNEGKVVFDLNEGLNGDDGKYTETPDVKFPRSSASIQLISPSPLQASSLSCSLPALITVAAAAKGPFVPPKDLLKNKGEVGWRGSAATSAFRPPAESRKTVDVNATSSPFPDPSKPTRPFFDFDLNVPDERVLEDLAFRGSDQAMTCVPDIANNHGLANDEVRSCGGLDLDLNKMDDDADIGNHLTMNGQQLDSLLQPVKTSSAGLLNNVSIRCDFDLNDGPLAEEVSVEASSFVQQSRNSIVSQTSLPAFRVSNKDLGNISSWFPQGNFQGVAFQSVLPVRGEYPFSLVARGASERMIAPASVSDAYRGPVLSSSPAAVAFPSAPFQYPIFPFGNNFPLPTAAFSSSSTPYVDSTSGGRHCFPTMQSQVLTPVGTVPSSYPRPYVNISDASNMGTESSRKWRRQGLDLNAGPLGPDREGRDETASLAPKQLTLENSQVLVEEQQSRIYQVSGGGVHKRKEPDGGWDGFRNSSWE
ncbi:BAH and coiled-coil domain-containing protein 1 [Linum perenne]